MHINRLPCASYLSLSLALNTVDCRITEFTTVNSEPSHHLCREEENLCADSPAFGRVLLLLLIVVAITITFPESQLSTLLPKHAVPLFSNRTLYLFSNQMTLSRASWILAHICLERREEEKAEQVTRAEIRCLLSLAFKSALANHLPPLMLPSPLSSPTLHSPTVTKPSISPSHTASKQTSSPPSTVIVNTILKKS